MSAGRRIAGSTRGTVSWRGAVAAAADDDGDGVGDVDDADEQHGDLD